MQNWNLMSSFLWSCEGRHGPRRRKTLFTDKPSRSWIGDWWEGWVSLVLLGILHLTHKDCLSPNQIHSDSSRFVQIQSFQPKSTPSHPDPPNLNQICSDSHRFLQSHTDLLSFIQFHTDSLRLTEFHTVPSRFTQSRSNMFRPIQSTQIHSDSLSLAPDSL